MKKTLKEVTDRDSNHESFRVVSMLTDDQHEGSPSTHPQNLDVGNGPEGSLYDEFVC